MNTSTWSAAMLSLVLLLAATGCATNDKGYRPLGDPPATRGN